MKAPQISLIVVAVAGVLLWASAFIYLRSPTFKGQRLAQIKRPDPKRLREHVERLSNLVPTRSWENPNSLSVARDYLIQQLREMGHSPQLQDVRVENNVFHNVVVRHGSEQAREIVVIGAHYDVAGTQNPGADDNASGVAGLLEFARMLKVHRMSSQLALEMVFYTLEEMPFFGTPSMGSYVHAADLKAKGIEVKYMISLEMIGYFDSKWGSQKFPLPVMYLFYPAQGDFIGLVSRPSERRLIRRLKPWMAANSRVPVLSINAPDFIPGIDLSDHNSYWLHGWPAVMVTDTAFLRNPHYHRSSDTADRLDYERMSEVVRGLFAAVITQGQFVSTK